MCTNENISFQFIFNTMINTPDQIYIDWDKLSLSKGTSLENIRQQSPDLYSASISMLKVMIEMAEMLGLKGNNQPIAEVKPEEMMPEDRNAVPDEEKPQEEQNSEWDDPFPTHPDQGGEAKPMHARSKNNPSPRGSMSSGFVNSPKPIGGSIGQPAGKLSSKHTTEHVARTPTPPGAINSKGQQKIIDPVTGKTRWIDRKQGAVQSATGVPIKSPSRGANNGAKN
jgi:hypothetical protein